MLNAPDQTSDPSKGGDCHIMDASPSPNHVNDLPADEPQSLDSVFGFPVGEPHGFDDLDVEVKKGPREEPEEEPEEDPE
ncbi:hypothetical protein Tco_0844460 [Tanacetum coccineum]